MKVNVNIDFTILRNADLNKYSNPIKDVFKKIYACIIK